MDHWRRIPARRVDPMTRGACVLRLYLMRQGGYMLPADSRPMSRPAAVALLAHFSARGIRGDVLPRAEARSDAEWSAMRAT
jgi:hypothetical protein